MQSQMLADPAVPMQKIRSSKQRLRPLFEHVYLCEAVNQNYQSL
jgi:hypothetical protein